VRQGHCRTLPTTLTDPDVAMKTSRQIILLGALNARQLSCVGEEQTGRPVIVRRNGQRKVLHALELF
ncbi:hypothetical protein, partial [Streptomyces sp. NPDC057838]|uniref:hypothetical protein n=1 Tax=unclassified Streptomyces TaxID=2593676 RepID=UPI003675B2FF